MAGAAAGGCMRRINMPELNDWFWMVRPHFAQQKEQPVKVVSIKIERLTNCEIIGSVQQLFKTKQHHGLFVKLCGSLRPGWREERDVFKDLFDEAKGGKKDLREGVQFPLCVPQAGSSSVVTTNAFQKFPFTLKFPVELNPPPSLDCGKSLQIDYKVVVFMVCNESWKFLGQTDVWFGGSLILVPRSLKCESTTPQARESVDGVEMTLELPKDEFILADKIPFELCLSDASGHALKKVLVCLKKFVTWKNEHSKTVIYNHVLSEVWFRRFLNRDKSKRRGSFEVSKMVPSVSWATDDSLWSFINVEYYVEARFWTKSKLEGKASIKVTFGTQEDTSFSATAPSLGDDDNPSAPMEDGGNLMRMGLPLPSAPFALATSMLSLFPPAYSQLSSRRGSTVSIETLPPNYDDLPSLD